MDDSRNAYLARRVVLEQAVAALMLLVLSPIIAMIAILIAVRMGRPILFRQYRVGQYGRTFTMLKFRTMIDNVEKPAGGYVPPEWNLVPPLGKKLRAHSLDELPQLINIARGDMSFVGPRPALPEHYALYTSEQARRVLVPQGLTGMAQVAYRDEAPWSLRIKKDLEYVSSVGPVLDLKILISTIIKLLRPDGVGNTRTPAEIDDFTPDG